MRTALPRLPKRLARGRIEWAPGEILSNAILSLDTKRPDDAAPLVLPKPPAGGLEKAEIEFT